MSLNDRFLFVYGPPAAGKSAVGLRLAQDLNLPFYDLDAEIEQANGKTIPEIFSEQGEAGFRGQEAASLREILRRPAGVVALGGGALLREENRIWAESAGRVVCLSSPFEVILERLNRSGGGRPLLDGDAEAQLYRLLEMRREHYASFPLQVESGTGSVEEAAWEAQIQLGVFHVRGMGRGYAVRIGASSLEELGGLLNQGGLGGPIALVSDTNVAGYHASAVQDRLTAAGFAAAALILPPGEETKTLNSVEQLLGGFLEAGLDRSSTVAALGGGVVGDLAGFAAAIFLRGLRWVALPSSLLAMVDASLGGKTGADLPQGKNLVGAFHPPALVLADPRLLDTLPETELRNGLAEVVKHAVLADPALFEVCRHGLDAVKLRLDQVVRRAMAVKLRVIQEDPYEQGRRAALNLGHTLGHGLELATRFRIKHGEAVAIGMSAAARLSEKMGLAERGLAEEIEACLSGLGLPTRIPPGVDLDLARSAMRYDKKRKAGRLRVVLPERIGAVSWGIELDDPGLLIDLVRWEDRR